MSRFLDRLIPSRRRAAIQRAKAQLRPRSIRIHSQASQQGFVRVAFEFLDPPGPYSMQFYEAAPRQEAVLSRLSSGTEARYYETRDEARIRIIETHEGEILWPR